MNKIQMEFNNKMNKALSKLELVYYDKKKTEFIPSSQKGGHSCFYIGFCLPFRSLKNLLEFCLLNGFILAYSDEGKMEINVGDIDYIGKMKIPITLLENKNE